MYSFVLVSPWGYWVIASLFCLCKSSIFWANVLKMGMTFYHGVHAFFRSYRRKPKVVYRFPTCPWQVQKNVFVRHFGEVWCTFLAWLSWFFLFSGKLDGGRVEFSLSSFSWTRFQTKQERVLFVKIRLSSNIAAEIKFPRDFPAWSTVY